MTDQPDLDIEAFRGKVALVINAMNEEGVTTFRLLLPTTDFARQIAQKIEVTAMQVDADNE